MPLRIIPRIRHFGRFTGLSPKSGRFVRNCLQNVRSTGVCFGSGVKLIGSVAPDFGGGLKTNAFPRIAAGGRRNGQRMSVTLQTHSLHHARKGKAQTEQLRKGIFGDRHANPYATRIGYRLDETTGERVRAHVQRRATLSPGCRVPRLRGHPFLLDVRSRNSRTLDVKSPPQRSRLTRTASVESPAVRFAATVASTVDASGKTKFRRVALD